jgi:hypothetical protein
VVEEKNTTIKTLKERCKRGEARAQDADRYEKQAKVESWPVSRWWQGAVSIRESPNSPRLICSFALQSLSSRLNKMQADNYHLEKQVGGAGCNRKWPTANFVIHLHTLHRQHKAAEEELVVLRQ